MSYGRTIRIHLVDGTVSGLRTVELINWTGIALVCQRSDLPTLGGRREPSGTGIYILTGLHPDNLLQEQIYIGEGDNVLRRLLSHDQSKDFWNQAVMFVSKDSNLTKAHVRYLESKLIRMAHEVRRSMVTNDQQPEIPPLPEADIADMEYFLEQVLLILPIVGVHSFQALPQTEQLRQPISETVNDLSPIFEMNVSGAHALAREYQGNFIVLKGSMARAEPRPSWTSYRQVREQLIHEQKLGLRPDGRYFEFQDDVSFTSPSAAASVVNAGNQNGRTVWRIEGKTTTYQQWLNEKLTQAGLLDPGDVLE